MNNSRLKAAYRAKLDASKLFDEVLALDFPPGAQVDWERGGHWHEGEIVQTFMGRAQVRNTKTGNVIWLDASYLANA